MLRERDLPFAPLEAITGDENLLLLVANPGEESSHCGGLVAQSCRRGRPPFVMVLADGSSVRRAGDVNAERAAARQERHLREAVGVLGLAGERVLMAGLYDGSVPGEGAVFEAVVRAVTLVMWARDCNVICAPEGGSGLHHPEAAGIAAAVAAGSGVGLLAYGASGVGAARLDISGEVGVKRAAVKVYRGAAPVLRKWEVFRRLKV